MHVMLDLTLPSVGSEKSIINCDHLKTNKQINNYFIVTLFTRQNCEYL